MKNFAFALLALIIVTPLIATGTANAEEHREVKLKLSTGGEMHTIDASDMEVGESRQFIGENDKEVVITRTEDGFTITVDGEEIDLGEHLHAGSSHGKHVVIQKHGEGHGDSDVIIRKKIIRMGDGDGDSETMVWHSDDGELHEVEGAHAVFMALGQPDVAKHLENAGALEGLTDEQRHRILSALAELDKEHHGIKKHVIVEVEDDGDA